MNIKKAIIPVAGLGTRFLPLTKAIPKPILPLADRPMIDYIVEEAKKSGIERIVFVLSSEKNNILDYFKKNPRLENILEKRNQKDILKSLKDLDKEIENISFSSVIQQNPKGDGDAILKAQKIIGKDACGVLFGDDVILSKVPVLEQLENVFKTCQKPIVCLKRVPKNMISSYGVVKVDKIANRLYKIKDIIEKPKKQEDIPSDLAIVGRYIITPLVFEYLKKVNPNHKGEIILAQALKDMLEDGKIVYGYEMEGEWLECGNKLNWLKSNLRICLQHPEFGPILKDYLKKI
jgi:UTP--glucose-1-phosphate uridylyltransferase